MRRKGMERMEIKERNEKDGNKGKKWEG